MSRRLRTEIVTAAQLPPLQQPELFEPSHPTSQPNRLRFGDSERVYYSEWVKRNRRDPAMNRGFTLLEWIMCPEGRYPQQVTQRDSAVAASFAQWLGTNCGMGYIWACERQIGELQAVRDQWRVSQSRIRASFAEQAALMTEIIANHPNRLQVQQAIEQALQRAHETAFEDLLRPNGTREEIRRGILL